MAPKILVIHDDEGIVDVLESALERAGFEFFIAFDRDTAADLLERERPVCVLMASHFESTEGSSLCRELRAMSQGESIPIFFIGAGDVADRIRTPRDALGVGGDYFFCTPADLDYVAGRIFAWIADTADDEARPASERASDTSDDLQLEAFATPTRLPAPSVREALEIPLSLDTGAVSDPPPERGQVVSTVDVLSLLAAIDRHRATGCLSAGDVPTIVFVEGRPSCLRGQKAHALLVDLLRKHRPTLGGTVPSRDEADASKSAMQIFDVLVEGDVVHPNEALAILHRHLEDAIVALLEHRGAWTFDAIDAASVPREEVVPDLDDPDLLIIDLLARVADAETLDAMLSLDACRAPTSAQFSTRRPTGRHARRDARFVALLEAGQTIAAASAVASTEPRRARSLALAHVLFGGGTLCARTLDDESSARPTVLDPEEVLRSLAARVHESDYFAILGVPVDATTESIEEAYRSLATLIVAERFASHPALSAMAKDVLRTVDEAHDVLAVPELRKAYLEHLRPVD